MDTAAVLSIVGTLVVVLFGFLLAMLKGLRSDIVALEDKIAQKVLKPDCAREMDIIRDDIKEVVGDVKDILRRKP